MVPRQHQLEETSAHVDLPVVEHHRNTTGASTRINPLNTEADTSLPGGAEAATLLQDQRAHICDSWSALRAYRRGRNLWTEG